MHTPEPAVNESRSGDLIRLEASISLREPSSGKEALDRPLFVRGRIQQVDPDSTLRDVGKHAKDRRLCGEPSTLDSSVRDSVRAAAVRRHQRFTLRPAIALWSRCLRGMERAPSAHSGPRPVAGAQIISRPRSMRSADPLPAVLLEREQELLGIETAGEARQVAVRPDDTVAGRHD